MSTLGRVVDALRRAAAAGDRVVLATVVRVIGSSYGGVGARMVVHADGTIVGLVSGGCLESDLVEHARAVHADGRARTVGYDTRADDDAVWGLGLGCNGEIEVLLEPLSAAEADGLGDLLAGALAGESPTVLATVVRVDDGAAGAPAVGAHALLGPGGVVRTTGAWGDDGALAAIAADRGAALDAGRRGLVRRHEGATVAFETIVPTVRLVVCGSGPDVLPVVRLAAELGWATTVVDHRPAAHGHAERFPGARVVACPEPRALGAAVALDPRTAAVVMSHHFGRDGGYLEALLAAGVSYVGVLGPRARTERLLAELAAQGVAPTPGARLYAPIGLDLGGDGPAAIALAVVAEVAAVVHGRGGGHLRDRGGALHEGAPGEPSASAERGRAGGRTGR